MPKSGRQTWLLFENSQAPDNGGESSSALTAKGQVLEMKSARLRLFGKLGIEGERLGLKETLSRLRWALISKGRARIFYVCHRREVVHCSFVIPACSKFSFLGTDDWEIGPCFTAPAWRGYGIYPTVLKRIISRGGAVLHDRLSHERLID